MLSVPTAGVWHEILGYPSVWILTFVLVVLFPVLDSVLYARLKSTLQIYIWNIAAEWLLTIACAWQIHSHGLRLADVGVRLGNPLRVVAVVMVLVALIAVLILVSRKQKNKATPAQMDKAIEKIRRLIPVSHSQRRVFIAVASTAGICEEFLYRGWLLNLLAAALRSAWVGLLLSAIVFGIAHAYQGRGGMISSGLLGCFFGVLFLITGSLLVAQVLHAVIDLKNGLALGKFAKPPEPLASTCT